MIARDVYIPRHICRRCEIIGEAVGRINGDYGAFTSDAIIHDAIAMNLLQIGELANSLSQEYRSETESRVPWSLIRGMRNWLAHAYGNTDDDILWGSATRDVPNLKEFCEREINRYETVDAPCAENGENGEA